MTTIFTNHISTRNLKLKNMKKIIFTILVAVMTLSAAQAGPQKKGSPKNVATEQAAEEAPRQDAANELTSDDEQETDVTDKVTLTNDGIVVKDDNGTVELKIADLYRIINEHLDDTVLSTGNQEISQLDSKDMNEMANRGMDLAEDISRGFFVAIVFIVFFSLLFYYLHRRRKYKTVDRAIQAGYPLPNEFFGKRSPGAPQQPTTVYVTQVTPPTTDPNPAHTSQGTTAPPHPQSSNPLNNITDWTPFKKGFITTAVGLGLLLFFWIAGATPVAALMVIVVFIGLGQLFIAYQEQQNLKNHWQQQWTQQPQQSQQQQWQQRNPQQPPHNVPPMPETPPEFNSNK